LQSLAAEDPVSCQTTLIQLRAKFIASLIAKNLHAKAVQVCSCQDQMLSDRSVFLEYIGCSHHLKCSILGHLPGFPNTQVPQTKMLTLPGNVHQSR
jgi:hypothetical protein